MNWITRCPECATVYQVEPEQLQAAKGWLRCGQCQHVFDSTGLMLAWSATSTAPVDVSTPGRVAIEDLLKQEDRSMATPPSHAAVDLASFEEALSSFKPEIEKTIVELSNKPSGMSVAEDMPAPADPQETDGTDPLPSRQPSKFWVWALLLGFLFTFLSFKTFIFNFNISCLPSKTWQSMNTLSNLQTHFSCPKSIPIEH